MEKGAYQWVVVHDGGKLSASVLGSTNFSKLVGTLVEGEATLEGNSSSVTRLGPNAVHATSTFRLRLVKSKLSGTRYFIGLRADGDKKFATCVAVFEVEATKL